MKWWQAAGLYALVLGILFVYRDALAQTVLHDRPSLLLAFGVAMCVIWFPVLPYKLVIMTFGFMYGPLVGFLLSWSAASIAPVLMFAAVRSGYGSQGRRYMERFGQLDRFVRWMERRPFAAILVARLIPVLPQAVVNIVPAFLSIPVATYAVASALGKIPAMVLFSYLGDRLFTQTGHALIAFAVYALLLLGCWIGYKLWSRKTADAPP